MYLSNDVLFENFANVWCLVDCEDVPVRLDSASGGSENDLAARMRTNPFGNVKDFVLICHPGSLRSRTVFFHFGQAVSGQAIAFRLGAFGGREFIVVADVKG